MADNNTSNLPREIIELFLSRLSLNSLLRCKAVCKSWNTIISDPVFVRIHHQRSKVSNSQTLLFLCKQSKYSSRFSLIRLDDRKSETVQLLEAPYGWKRVLCFCEGLLLVYGHEYRRISLWNPSTGADKRLWLPYSCFSSNYGLCHDPITDDFKVVIMDWDFYTVYSFKNNSWKKRINYECIDCGLPDGIPGVCVNGASYWVWYNEDGGTEIIYFDPRDDKFKILDKPGNIVEDNADIYLVDLGGRLCLYCNDRDDEKTVRIWTKKKGIDNNSWKELMTVVNVSMPIWSFQPQCFIGNKVLIRNESCNSLVLYSPYEKRFERFDNTAVFDLGLVPWVDSAFFPTQNPKPERKRKRL